MSEEVDVSGGASGQVVSSLSLSEDSEGESEVSDEVVAVAQPPEATSQADQEALMLTGSAALDILDQVRETTPPFTCAIVSIADVNWYHVKVTGCVGHSTLSHVISLVLWPYMCVFLGKHIMSSW